jgi:hypothetical protein
MRVCEDGHPALIYDDGRGRAACPVCWLDDTLTSRLEAKDGEITALYTQISVLEGKLAASLGHKGVLAGAETASA